MKKTIATIGLALTLSVGVIHFKGSARAQQITPQVQTVTNVPPVTWTGTNAQALAAQVLSLTNADGSAVIPSNFLTNKPVVTIIVRVTNDTNGLPQSITAIIH